MSKRRYSDFVNRIDLDAFEEAIGFDPFSNERGEDIGYCIFPEAHTHGDTSGKFAINREKRVWNCVTGDTLVQHHLGFAYANWLAGKQTTVLGSDGEYHATRWHSFGVQDVYEVKFENGDVIKTTADHRWLTTRIKGDPWREDRRAWVTTSELEGRRVPLQTANRFGYDEEEWRKGVIHGMCFGDGHLYMEGRYARLDGFGDEDRVLIRQFGGPHISEYDRRRPMTVARRLPPEYKSLPTWFTQDLPSRSRSYYRGFIAGLMAADGHVPKNASPLIHQANLEVLEEVRLIAALAGLPTTSIRMGRQKNPWTGEDAPLYCLTFVKAGFVNDGKIDDHLILKPSHLANAQSAHMERKNTHTVKVVSVTELEEPEEVFCCVEPDTTTWTTGMGYLTGNCYVCGGGDLLSLAMLHTGKDFEEATDWLWAFAGPDRRTDDRFVDDLLLMLEDVHERRKTMPYFNDRVLDQFTDSLDYFRERGGTPEVIEALGLRYGDQVRKAAPVKVDRDGNRTKIDEDYTGPASIWPHYWQGKLVGWQSRWTNFSKEHDKTPKWLPKWTNTTDFPKGTTLYNYEYCLKSKDRIVVCESLGTVLFLRSCNVAAVSYFGSKPTPEQMRLLRRFTQGVILAPDNDANMAGDKIYGTTTYLERFIPVYLADKVEGPDGADLGDYVNTDDPYENLMTHLENRVHPAGLSV
jgi:hypothetical protein